MKLDELKRLVDYCRKNGVTRLKTGDTEIELHAEDMKFDPKQAKALSQALGRELSAEEMLFYSADMQMPTDKLKE